jgi:hypothetical protein
MTTLVLPVTYRRQPFPAWLLVVLLHLAVGMSLWKLPVWRDRGGVAAERPPLMLHLWWPSLAPTPPPTTTPPPAKRSPVPVRAAITLWPEPQAITATPALGLPAGTSLGTSVGTRTAPSPSPLPEQAPPQPAQSATPAAPLNLNLPRSASAPWRQRNPALDDPRSNSAKLTMEQKLSNAMGGDGSWVEERVDLDTVRYRRGGECIQAIRSRAGQLELSNGAFRNAWLVRGC